MKWGSCIVQLGLLPKLSCETFNPYVNSIGTHFTAFGGIVTALNTWATVSGPSISCTAETSNFMSFTNTSPFGATLARWLCGACWLLGPSGGSPSCGSGGPALSSPCFPSCHSWGSEAGGGGFPQHQLSPLLLPCSAGMRPHPLTLLQRGPKAGRGGHLL